jgi:hypothetical protein
MMEPILKLFVAGSKELITERMICRSVCSKLQNKWGTIETRTYEDFESTFSTVAHQAEYNEYITNETDVAIFIFSGKVGTITKSEFDTAWKSLTSSGHPKILVYFDNSPEARTPEVEELKAYIDSLDRYYKEYSDLKELEDLVKDHIEEVLINKMKSSNWRESKILRWLGVSGIIVGIWSLMAFIGGVGMYIYDRNMSEDKCLEIVVKYVQSDRGERLLYRLPDAMYVYDIAAKQLDRIDFNDSFSQTDITIPKIEHATIGLTASLLFSRVAKFKVKGNTKVMLGYVAAVTASAVGFGVGCVVEQMIFPPQYSASVEEFLSDPANWEKINVLRFPDVRF